MGRIKSLFLETRLSGLCLIALLLCAWEASVRLGLVVSMNWPPFSAVLVALYGAILDGELISVIASTLWRMARGYAIGCAIGLPLGLALATSPMIRRLVGPTIELLRPIPVPAIIPPLIFVFGINDPIKLFAVAFAVLFPVALNTLGGVAAVEPMHLQVARTFGVSRATTLRKVILPSALPFILAGLRASLAFALIVTVVAEMIAGSAGIGYYLNAMQFAMRAPDMYAAIILLAVVAYLLNRMFVEWEAWLIPWARLRDNAG